MRRAFMGAPSPARRIVTELMKKLSYRGLVAGLAVMVVLVL